MPQIFEVAQCDQVEIKALRDDTYLYSVQCTLVFCYILFWFYYMKVLNTRHEVDFMITSKLESNTQGYVLGWLDYGMCHFGISFLF